MWLIVVGMAVAEELHWVCKTIALGTEAATPIPAGWVPMGGTVLNGKAAVVACTEVGGHPPRIETAEDCATLRTWIERQRSFGATEDGLPIVPKVCE